MEKNTKYITYLATFTALTTLANCLSSLVGGTIQITVTYIPCFLAGIFLGPVGGFVAGALGDALGMLIMPQGAWIPLITLSSGLIGFIPGVIFKYVKIKSATLKLLFGFALCLVVCTAGLNSFAVYLVYMQGKKTFIAFLASRLPVQCLMAAVNFVIVAALLKVKPLVKALTIKK